MSAISLLNPKAEVARAAQALAVNISAAKGIQDVLKTNLGPKGTMKMLVSGAGDIKITKDGNVLLHEMQIQHPTASLIARASTAQDDVTGDGTTSTVLLIGEFLKQAELYISEGLHPRVVTEGFDAAKAKALEILESMKVSLDDGDKRETLIKVASTSLKTKVHPKMADQLTEICVDAMLSIDQKALDLHMVEIMEMQHRTESDTSLVRGLVLDHGGRHPEMPKRLNNCYILTCNVSLEYEKTEVNSGFFYKTAAEREKFLEAERKFIDDRVQKIIDFKRKVCADGKKSFVIINQKGIDPLSLDALAKEGILALRRAKRRNMERMALACGGEAMNTLEDLNESCLGYAGSVFEYVLGENKFTFVEECKNPQSVTILLKAPNKHSLVQMKDAIRDGLRAISNTLQDGYVVPGCGAFEVAVHLAIRKSLNDLKGKERLGLQAFADGMLIIPKTLAQNAGYDPQEVLVKVLADASDLAPVPVGVDCSTGEPVNPLDIGVLDNYRVKKQVAMINDTTGCGSQVRHRFNVVRNNNEAMQRAQTRLSALESCNAKFSCPTPVHKAELGLGDTVLEVPRAGSNITDIVRMIHSCTVIASNLLLVDEIMRAGLSSLKGN